MIKEKLQSLGVDSATTSFFLPLNLWKSWTDSELQQLLEEENITIILNRKVDAYLRQRFADMGFRGSEINKYFVR